MVSTSNFKATRSRGRSERTEPMVRIIDRVPVLASPRARQRLAQVNLLDRAVRKRLPRALAPHCRVADYHSGVLVLITESPVWAARLRFHVGDLRRALRDQPKMAISAVRVRVSPARAPTVQSGAGPTLSAAGSAHIAAAASSLEPGPLREALERLAGRAGHQRRQVAGTGLA
jgi:hypothetical protein